MTLTPVNEENSAATVSTVSVQDTVIVDPVPDIALEAQSQQSRSNGDEGRENRSNYTLVDVDIAEKGKEGGRAESGGNKDSELWSWRAAICILPSFLIQSTGFG